MRDKTNYVVLDMHSILQWLIINAKYADNSLANLEDQDQNRCEPLESVVNGHIELC